MSKDKAASPVLKWQRATWGYTSRPYSITKIAADYWRLRHLDGQVGDFTRLTEAKRAAEMHARDNTDCPDEAD